ncbi:MAG: caspase family protein [Scytolyngbya sp. HA4215-MV1]|nr:caspase family protein [Scytolyngbya sp. HA4215-MV1]
MKRRQWLQIAGSTIAALGIDSFDLQQKALHYGRVLAQSTPRKKALLVGINQYTGVKKGEWLPLQGAVNDVDLQHELLTLRFGFHPHDVKVLKDKNATRANILQVFQDHLIRDTQPGDVIVFHFSGHGSNVIDDENLHGDHVNGTIVPYDNELPLGYPHVGGEVNDITAGTLFLLMAALKTENVTVVLDSCYAGAGVRGNLIVRSRPGHFELRGGDRSSKLAMSLEEQAYQAQWLKDLHLPQEQWLQLRKDQIANGVAILAATRNQQAVDAVFAGDIHSGVFTHALTQYLWQTTSSQTVRTVIHATQDKTEKFLKTVPNSQVQTPYFEAKPGRGNDEKPVYFASFANALSADAVITQVQGNQVRLLLTVDPTSVESMGRGAQLQLVDANGEAQGTVTVTSRQQLEAVGILQLKNSSKVVSGSVLQEQIRAIPRNITLRVGLHDSLGADQATAKALLQAIPQLEALSLLQQEVHVILGRKDGRIGLFSPGFDLVPDSIGTVGETVTDAIERLRATFSLLLAARILKLMLNAPSSQLKVSVAMRMADSSEVLAQSLTGRQEGRSVQTLPSQPKNQIQSLPQLKVGQKFQLVVRNKEAQPLYIGVVFLNPDGTVLPYPIEILLQKNEERTIPPQAGIELQSPLGVAEILAIASTVSVEKALNALAALRNSQSEARRGEAAVAAVDQLLDDLDATTRHGKPASDVRLVDTRQMATLSIAFEIVA